MGGVLIVADDNQAGSRFANFFQAKGFTATLWNDSAFDPSGLKQLQPDFILLAAHQGGTQASQLCQQLKLNPETNLIPVIVTGDHEPTTQRRPGYYFLANAYVRDDSSVEQMERALNAALAWRAAARQEAVQAEIHVQLHSDLRLLDEFNKLLAEHLRQRGLAEPEAKQVTMAVRELGANAIEWGHRRQIDRIVTIHARLYERKISIVIRDTGPGFNRCELPHAASADDPISHLSVREELGLREGGFGIMIAGGLVDELHYNETGNEVRLVKHLTTPADMRGAGI